MGKGVEKGSGVFDAVERAGVSAATTQPLSIRLLGPLRVLRGEVAVPLPASRKARGLLAYLLMSPRPLHRSRVCEVFWDVPNDPRGELRWCLSKLRSVIDDPGTKRVQAGQDIVAIDVATLDVDALRIDAAAAAVVAGSDISELERLAALFDGVFLEGVVGDRTPPFEAWLAGRRDHFGAVETGILSRLAALLPSASDRRFRHLRRLVDLAPDDLRRHRDLLRALADAERMGEAHAHLGLARRSLKAHGLDPAPLEAELSAARRRVSPVTPAGPKRAGEAPAPTRLAPRPAAKTARTVTVPKSARVAPAPDRPTAAHNLPPSLSSYIRRSAEEAGVRSRLVRHRLVTLVGPGGAGKTRLALEIGRGLLHQPSDEFSNRPLDEPLDGVWLVELAGLTDPVLVGEALCSCIGAAVIDSRSSADGAARYLQDKRAVVILDNCEHLIDAVTDVTLTLLNACPRLSLIATSRERLGVPGEGLFQVPGLSLPPASASISAGSARGHDAIRLFEERAGAVIEGFALSDANANAVADVCRMLDGFPMAIELVVPQLRMVSPQALATRLKNRVLFVSKGVRGAAERHRTLRALFDWSYKLLADAERALFRRLAVFTGGWTLDAAVAVVADELVAAEEVFDLLSRLVETSLVVADLTGPVPRYCFLETTRRYAQDKLVESGDPDSRGRLLAVMTDQFAAADQAWSTTPTASWLAVIAPDLDNLRSSLDWALSDGADVLGGLVLCAYGLRIWDEMALLQERERWFAVASAQGSEAAPVAILARLCLGRTSNSAHGDRANFDLAWRAADLFREAGDIGGMGEALARAGAALATLEATREAVLHLTEALRLLKPLGASKPLSACLRSLAVAGYFDRDFEGAREFLLQSRRAAQAVGDLRGVANVQIAAAELAFAAGDTEEAMAQTEAMLSAGDCNGRQRVLGLTNLVAYRLAADRLVEARHAALDGMSEARALGWRGAVVRVVEHLALLSALTGDVEPAATLLGHCVAFYAKGAGSREFTELATFDRLTGLLRIVLPPERVQALMEEGATWSSDQAILCAFAIASG